MFDLSLAEIMVVVVATVIFIGPKELPVVVKAISKAVRYLKSVANDFRKMFDELADEAGVKEMEKDIRLIKGDDGNMYESYDTSHLEPKKTHEQRH